MAEFADRLMSVRVRFALQHPFLASPLMRLPLRDVGDVSWCPTMATDGYHIFFNPTWSAKLPDSKLMGVIAHELLHVVFGHVDRRQGRAPVTWNIACDFAVNHVLELQGIDLPKGALRSYRFIGRTAEQIYDMLQQNLDLLGESDGDGFPGALGGTDLLQPDDPRVTAVGDSDAPDEEGRRQLRSGLSIELRSKVQGNSAGSLALELSIASRRAINWHDVLRAWMTDRVRTDWCLYPFAKKHLWRGFYLPSVGATAPGHILFAIDTSGSMDDRQLGEIAAEVRGLREMFPSKLTQVQCDAGVQSLEEFEEGDAPDQKPTIRVTGRGGTDFRPVFELLATSHRDVALVIFATDGFGTFPSTPPERPCLWLVTEDGLPSASFPFGTVIRMTR